MAHAKIDTSKEQLSFSKLFGNHSERILHFRNDYSHRQQAYEQELRLIRQNVSEYFAPVRREEANRNLRCVAAAAHTKRLRAASTQNSEAARIRLQKVLGRKKVIVVRASSDCE